MDFLSFNRLDFLKIKIIYLEKYAEISSDKKE